MNPLLENLRYCGHGIVDIDTEKLITIANGEVVSTEISSIIKGEKDKPRGNKRKHKKQ